MPGFSVTVLRVPDEYIHRMPVLQVSPSHRTVQSVDTPPALDLLPAT